MHHQHITADRLDTTHVHTNRAPLAALLATPSTHKGKHRGGERCERVPTRRRSRLKRSHIRSIVSSVVSLGYKSVRWDTTTERALICVYLDRRRSRAQSDVRRPIISSFWTDGDRRETRVLRKIFITVRSSLGPDTRGQPNSQIIPRGRTSCSTCWLKRFGPDSSGDVPRVQDLIAQKVI